MPQRLLVAIRRGGSQPPLFAVPGVGGSVIYYQRLARLLGDDQPFYGLESQGVDGLAQPLTRIEDIAAVFLRAIRTVQSEGPYYLLGACIGGVVAWEIAQQLLLEGQEVCFLAMLGLPQQDSKARGGLGPRALAVRELMMGRLRLYGETFRRLRGPQRFEYLRQRISALSQLIRRGNWTRGNRAELYREMVTQANLVAFRRYAPRPYAGPVVVFRARRSDGADDCAQWRELAEGGVEVHTVSGDNSGLMLVEPHVQAVAAELKACLERARSRVAEQCRSADRRHRRLRASLPDARSRAGARSYSCWRPCRKRQKGLARVTGHALLETHFTEVATSTAVKNRPSGAEPMTEFAN